jgi:hypothetical protein
MSGNPLVRFDEGRVGRTARCRPLSYVSSPMKTNDEARRRPVGKLNRTGNKVGAIVVPRRKKSAV